MVVRLPRWILVALAAALLALFATAALAYAYIPTPPQADAEQCTTTAPGSTTGSKQVDTNDPSERTPAKVVIKVPKSKDGKDPDASACSRVHRTKGNGQETGGTAHVATTSLK